MSEVITIGAGEYMVNIFQAVAAMSGGGGFKSLMRVIMVMGLIYSLLVMAFNLDWKAGFQWFLSSTLIYSCMMVPTVTVKVTDRINPSLAPSTIANVPIGLAVMASFSSKVSDYFTRTSETVFVMPNALAYTQNGMVYGNKLLDKTKTITIKDATMNANLSEYIKMCVYYDVLLGQTEMNTLAKSTDLWTAMGPGATNRAMRQVVDGGPPEIVTCRVGYNNLSVMWANKFYNDEVPIWAKGLYPNLTPNLAKAKLDADLTQVLNYFVGSSQNSQTMLRQVALADAFALAQYNFGNNEADAFAILRAETQAKNTQSAVSNQAMTWVPLLNIVLTSVFYAMFPIIFPLFLFPRTGIATMKGYFGGFFYLAMWGPLYVVLHMFLTNRSASALSGAGQITLASSDNGVALTTMAGIYGVNEETASLAGYLMMSVPFLAAALARGAMAISHHAGSMLQAASSGAEAAAVDRTTGNYAFGNVSHSNLSANNTQANHFDTAPSYVTAQSPMARHRDASGSHFTNFGDGFTVVDNAQGRSNLGMKADISSSVVATFRAQASANREEANRFERGEGNTSSDGWKSWHSTRHTDSTSSGSRKETFNRNSNGFTASSQIDASAGGSSSATEYNEDGTRRTDRWEHVERANKSVSARMGLNTSLGAMAGGTGAAVSGQLGKGTDVSTTDAESKAREDFGADGGRISKETFNRHTTTTGGRVASDYSSGNNNTAYSANDSVNSNENGTENFHNEVQEQREYAAYLRSEARRLDLSADQVQSGGSSIVEDITNQVQSRYVDEQAKHPGMLPDIWDTRVTDPSMMQARRTAVERIVGDIAREGGMGAAAINARASAAGLDPTQAEGLGTQLIDTTPSIPRSSETSKKKVIVDTGPSTQPATHGGLAMPVHGPITSEYGERRGAKTHNALDIAVPVGTPVKAGASGTIIRAWNDREHGGGLSMLVKYDNGMVAGFAHLSRFEGQRGDRVNAGDVVALSGNTGRSTGPHLHYTLRASSGSGKVNPLKYSRR